MASSVAEVALRMRRRGVTLIELLIAVVVIGIVVALAGPSLYDFILLQRLKGVTAQVLTDLQFARAEAAARNLPVRVRVSSSTGSSCYVVYTGNANTCNCLNTPVCGAASNEIRTVRVAAEQKVRIVTPMSPPEFAYNPATGAMLYAATDEEDGGTVDFVINTTIDTARALSTRVRMSGRPGICAPAGSRVREPAC